MEEGSTHKGPTLQTRKELRAKNEHPVRPNADEVKKLDGSLKKTSTFKAKLKTSLTAEAVDTLKRDILVLKLDKYLSEIVTVLVSEARLAKAGDVWAAVEVASLLHQRFADFVDLVVAALAKVFVFAPAPVSNAVSPEQRERDEAGRVAKQKIALRLWTEFYLVGLLDVCAVLPKKENPLVAVVQKMFNLNTDKDFANVPIAVTFCKSYEQLILADKALTEESLVPDNVRAQVKQILADYYAAVSKHLVKMHKYIKKAEVSNYEHAVARGEVSEERQERFQKASKVYEALLKNVQSMSNHLGLEMPDLPEPEDSLAGKLSIGLNVNGRAEGDDEEALLGGPWEDEESRSFYQDVIDLKDVVPAILLGEKHEKPAAPSAADLELLNNVIQVSNGTDDSQQQSDEADEESSPVIESGEMDLDDVGGDEDTKDASATRKQQVDAFFNGLPNALSTEAIDKLAVEFCYINTKNMRKRLVKTLFAVPRQRLDILPYYSRLIATLNPFMPEIATSLIALLEKEFHYHQRKTDRTFVEEKIKVVRFIGELTKFSIPEYHVTFHFFKVMLESFTNHNIEAVCSMLEVCGRYLYKTPETSRPTGNVLEIMMKKKTALNLDSRLSLLIDNAFYVCNPPEKTAVQQKERPPLELYIRKLFYLDLSKKTSERILKQLRMFNWNDPETVSLIQKPFFKCWKVKFSNLHVLAFLAFELSRYYPEFGVAVVDQCLEEMRLGLESNLFKHNQKRVSTVRFLGELYNYRLIESSVVFDSLYFLLRFGYDSPFPEPGVYSPLDAPHDFFRVRLCCLLLETCGQCFDRGPLAAKLDEFLCFLQVYLHCKPRLSMDVEFLMVELFDLLRPKWKLCTSYDEAVEKFNALVVARVGAVEVPVEEEEEDGEEEWGRVGGEDDDGEEGGDGSQEEDGGSQEEDEGEEDVVVHMPEAKEEEVDAELEAEFDKEFSKMMQESLESRKFDKKTQAFDVAIPVKRGVAFQGGSAASAAAAASPMDGVVFSFLTKKGNKQQLKSVELPQDSTFVLSTKQKQEAEMEEKKQLKKLVLNLDEKADDEDVAAAVPTVMKAKTNNRQRQHRPNVIPKSLFE
ncbi:ARM repeat-containing protein [Rhizoclosmatium globosum]|uniref:ARM repeat-containing protein n=1 Tax=Rhizoclosmatium globosum TaxID=329046 RepID=A0A1Y2BUH2_9FUNG|nr:ARM repeat-containing protein [Rhizoclosmatium globosum]|eukprot:ORY37765.1 ARM repeat-containing protein [Rhizoclosmatium globosum]